jgi:hypothetical protein
MVHLLDFDHWPLQLWDLDVVISTAKLRDLYAWTSVLFISVLGSSPFKHISLCHLWKKVHTWLELLDWLAKLLQTSCIFPRLPCEFLQYSKMCIQRWTCYIISMPSCRLVPKWCSNHNITSVLGWQKSTANIPPRLDLPRPRASCSQVVHPRSWNMLHQFLPYKLVNHSSLIQETWNKDHNVNMGV